MPNKKTAATYLAAGAASLAVGASLFLSPVSGGWATSTQNQATANPGSVPMFTQQRVTAYDDTTPIGGLTQSGVTPGVGTQIASVLPDLAPDTVYDPVYVEFENTANFTYALLAEPTLYSAGSSSNSLRFYDASATVADDTTQDALSGLVSYTVATQAAGNLVSTTALNPAQPPTVLDASFTPGEKVIVRMQYTAGSIPGEYAGFGAQGSWSFYATLDYVAPPQLSYANTTFTTGSNLEVLSPTLTGGAGTPTYSVTGTLPDGVTFDTATGTFTGPADSAWNFQVAQVSSGQSHTCAVTAAGGAKCWGDNWEGQLGNGANADSSQPVDVSGLTSGVSAISAGNWFTCALLTSGAVKCWGNNGRGQLGDGTNNKSNIPVPVTGLYEGVASISAGSDSHTCAVLTSGAAKCWGWNSDGQLGNGDTTDSSTPVDVSSLGSGVASISAGATSTCAVLTSGAAKCWGDGAYGALGNGSATDSAVPVDVSGLGSGVSDISVAPYHACAVLTSGAAKCWGTNDSGQLGDGSTNPSSTPIQVTGLNSGVISVAAGYNHTCAVLTSGAAKCWGLNNRGQLGDSSANSSSTPVQVTGLAGGVTSIATGDAHTCATLQAGAVKCWGWNIYGGLGDGTTTNSTSPVTVLGAGPQPGFPAEVTVLATDASGSTSSTVTLDYAAPLQLSYANTSFTTGSNLEVLSPTLTGGAGTPTYSVTGTLPDGVTFDTATGVFTGPASNAWNFTATQVDSGNGTTCALVDNGSVKCWGDNTYNQLGDGTTTSSLTPVSVSGITNATSISLGDSFGCALLSSGSVKCWGANWYNNLGTGTADYASSSVPVDVVGISDATQIAAGMYSVCALLSSGTVKCWGDNGRGQLGTGQLPTQSGVWDSATPLDVVDVQGAAHISGGYDRACATLSSGSVKCWGSNYQGALGSGKTLTPGCLYSGTFYATWTQSTCTALGGTWTSDYAYLDSGAPILVPDISDAVSVDSGNGHTCARRSGGSIACWGYNYWGQLGNGTATNSDTPVAVTGITTATQIALGPIHSCALLSTGEGRCWGYNGPGTLGDGLYSNPIDGLPGPAPVVNPVPVSMTVAGIVDIGSGSPNTSNGKSYVTCVLLNDGSVQCVGDNQTGQLGNGATTGEDVPNPDFATVIGSGPQPGFPATVDVTVTGGNGTATSSVTLSQS